DAAPHVRAGLDRRGRQDAAHRRMPETERSRHVGQDAAELERVERARLPVERVVMGAVLADVMAARRAERRVQVETLRLDDAPGRDPLPAHAIAILPFL